MSQRDVFTNLRRAVYAAAKAAFTEIRARHVDETFYVFGLWTDDGAQFVRPVANTIEGLKRTVTEYQSNVRPDYTEDDLRWSYGDFAYVCAGVEHFDAASALLWQAVDSDKHRCLDGLADKAIAVFADALGDLNKEGFFGQGAERAEVAVLIVGQLGGDVTDDYLAKLNPPEVVRRFGRPKSTQGKFFEVGSMKLNNCKGMGTSADGRLLIVAGAYHVVGFSLPDFQETMKKSIGSDLTTWDLALAPDGTEFATAWQSSSRGGGGIERWSFTTKKRIHSFPVIEWGYTQVAYSPDGKILASGSRDKCIRLWAVQTGELIREMMGHDEHIRQLGFSPNGRWLASIDESPGSLRIWDAESGALVLQMGGHGGDFVFTPDSQYIAVVPGWPDVGPPRVQFWNVRDGSLARTLEVGIVGHSIAISSNGDFIALGGCNPGIAELWDLKTGTRRLVLDADYSSIEHMKFVNCDSAVAMCGWNLDNRPPLLVWDISCT